MRPWHPIWKDLLSIVQPPLIDEQALPAHRRHRWRAAAHRCDTKRSVNSRVNHPFGQGRRQRATWSTSRDIRETKPHGRTIWIYDERCHASSRPPLQCVGQYDHAILSRSSWCVLPYANRHDAGKATGIEQCLQKQADQRSMARMLLAAAVCPHNAMLQCNAMKSAVIVRTEGASWIHDDGERSPSCVAIWSVGCPLGSSAAAWSRRRSIENDGRRRPGHLA